MHRELGPGLLESAYEKCLAFELAERGHTVRCQVPLPLHYRGVELECGYRIDMVVDNAVVLELKAVEEISPLHEAQLLSYLRLSGHRRGLLINFHVRLLRDGIKRFVQDPQN